MGRMGWGDELMLEGEVVVFMFLYILLSLFSLFLVSQLKLIFSDYLNMTRTLNMILNISY